ncbi:MAG: DNA recombination protein RmuC [bacterium]|nr:DNA recombination protein RmuC [bacterium]
METLALISALAISVLAAIGFAVAWDRQRRAEPAVDTDALLQKVVTMAAGTFRAHLDTGKAQLAHQREVIDRKWDGVTSQVNEELSELRNLVTDMQKERAAQHAGLTQNLVKTSRQQDMLLRSTQRLNDILTNSQARGQWGERMADDILRTAGLVEGVNYHKQKTTSAGTRPDFTFLLPDGQVLHMDVKFPLEAYARYVEASTDIERQKALRDFGTAVKGHVKALACREAYKDPSATVGYVLMFIPNDGVYAFIHEHHRSVFDEALDSRVVICSPSTLFAMLALVRQAMDTLAMERSSREILDHLACFTDQWQRYVDQFDLVGRHLGRLNSAFDDLSTTRRNQLERQLDRIEELKNRSGQEALDGGTEAEPAPRVPHLLVT